MGYTAPKNALYKRLMVVKRGGGEMQKGAWHLGSIVHNVLNMRHKGRWHAFGSEHAQISLGVCLQQLPQQTQRLITTRPTIMVLGTQSLGGYWDVYVAKLLQGGACTAHCEPN